jgi:hypothetical protein
MGAVRGDWTEVGYAGDPTDDIRYARPRGVSLIGGCSSVAPPQVGFAGPPGVAFREPPIKPGLPAVAEDTVPTEPFHTDPSKGRDRMAAMRKPSVHQRQNIERWWVPWYESEKRKAGALPTKTLAKRFRYIEYTRLNSDGCTSIHRKSRPNPACDCPGPATDSRPEKAKKSRLYRFSCVNEPF